MNIIVLVRDIRQIAPFDDIAGYIYATFRSKLAIFNLPTWSTSAYMEQKVVLQSGQDIIYMDIYVYWLMPKGEWG